MEKDRQEFIRPETNQIPLIENNMKIEENHENRIYYQSLLNHLTFPFYPFISFKQPCQDTVKIQHTSSHSNDSSFTLEKEKTQKEKDVKSQSTISLIPRRRSKKAFFTSQKNLYSNQESFNQYREQKKNKKKRYQFNSSAWNMKEERNYIKFLKNNRSLFDLSVPIKKTIKLNVLMSEKIISRSPQQCHSHHQKMVRKYGSIDNVVADHELAIVAQKQMKKWKKIIHKTESVKVKEEVKIQD